VISTAVGAASPGERVPIVAIFGVTASIGVAILLADRRPTKASRVAEPAPRSEAERADLGRERDAADAGCCRSGSSW
jgi:hypothetical protein